MQKCWFAYIKNGLYASQIFDWKPKFETLFIVFFGNWIHHCWSINFILSSYFAYRNKNMERRLYSKEWTAGLLQSIYKVRSQQAVVELPPWSRLFTDRQLTCSRMSSHRMVSSLGPNAARSVADTLNDDNKHIIVQTYICMINYKIRFPKLGNILDI